MRQSRAAAFQNVAAAAQAASHTARCPGSGSSGTKLRAGTSPPGKGAYSIDNMSYTGAGANPFTPVCAAMGAESRAGHSTAGLKLRFRVCMSVLAISRPNQLMCWMAAIAAASSKPSAASRAARCAQSRLPSPSQVASSVARLTSALRPCRPWRSKRSTSSRVRPAVCTSSLSAACTPGKLATACNARCSHTSRSLQRCTAAEPSAPGIFTNTCTLGGVALPVRSRSAGNFGNSPAALNPATPRATASSASTA